MNLQAIYPPLPVRLIKGACTSCKGDVGTDCGFADLDGPPFKAYLCASCGNLALPRSGMASVLIQESQDRFRRAQSTGQAPSQASVIN